MSNPYDKQILVIVGPTASKKSELGYHLAKRYNGEIINADAMQIYKEIPIITSSPEYKHLNVNHHLYNFLSITEHFSPIKYVNLATENIKSVNSNGKLPIVIGGSGLYIHTLINGYNLIPEISLNTKQQVESLVSRKPINELWYYLVSLDHQAKIIGSNDKQRIMRALEVVIETGCSIFEFTKNPNIIPLPEFQYKIIFLCPQRELLHQMINKRVIRLLEAGAIEEIKIVQEIISNNTLLANKALGVREILSYLNGVISIEELINKISISTRQYAKRQITWFKNQIKYKNTATYDSNDAFEQLKNISWF